MKRKIRIMLVEDHPEYREMLEMVLRREPDIELISQFGNSEQALRSLQDRSTRNVPDLVLLDLHLPGMGGIEALPYFKSSLPDTKVIILTQSNKEADVLNAIQHGAAGYLLKSSTMMEITQGIRTVVDGGATLDSGLATFILKTLKTRAPNDKTLIQLTNRESEILVLIGDGLSQKEIAAQLNISYYTVITHLGHVYEKLNVVNAPAAVAKAFRAGILPLDE